MQSGTLFTEDFLREGICQTPDWQKLEGASLESVRTALKAIIEPFEAGAAHNEADTEERVIY